MSGPGPGREIRQWLTLRYTPSDRPRSFLPSRPRLPA